MKPEEEVVLIWFIPGAEAEDGAGGTGGTEEELPAAGFAELPFEVGLNALPVDVAAGPEFGAKGPALPGVGWPCEAAGGVWYLGGINRLLSSCRVAK